MHAGRRQKLPEIPAPLWNHVSEAVLGHLTPEGCGDFDRDSGGVRGPDEVFGSRLTFVTFSDLALPALLRFVKIITRARVRNCLILWGFLSSSQTLISLLVWKSEKN